MCPVFVAGNWGKFTKRMAAFPEISTKAESALFWWPPGPGHTTFLCVGKKGMMKPLLDQSSCDEATVTGDSTWFVCPLSSCNEIQANAMHHEALCHVGSI